MKPEEQTEKAGFEAMQCKPSTHTTHTTHTRHSVILPGSNSSNSRHTAKTRTNVEADCNGMQKYAIVRIIREDNDRWERMMMGQEKSNVGRRHTSPVG